MTGNESWFGEYSYYSFYLSFCFQRPVIIKNSRLVQSAVDRWDLNFIVSNVGGSQRVTLSDSRQFLFHQKIEDPEMLQFEWEPPFKGYKGVIADFVDLVEKLEEKRNGSYSYLQVSGPSGASL